MSFDIDKTIGDMLSAASDVISGDWPHVKDCIEQAFKAEKDALKEIAEARIDGLIDDDDMKSQLEDEKVALEAALLACRVRAKIMAQNAINAAINVFKEAISLAL
ncbi:MAG: hypothetical protein PVG66_14305 [Chromatiales bacterium]|jgi:hypothetical protein